MYISRSVRIITHSSNQNCGCFAHNDSFITYNLKSFRQQLNVVLSHNRKVVSSTTQCRFVHNSKSAELTVVLFQRSLTAECHQSTKRSTSRDSLKISIESIPTYSSSNQNCGRFAHNLKSFRTHFKRQLYTNISTNSRHDTLTPVWLRRAFKILTPEPCHPVRASLIIKLSFFRYPGKYFAINLE